MPRIARHHRRGISLIEAVCAVAMLGLVGAGMFGTVDFLLSRQVAQERKLAAMELANRLMLQHLDDPRELEDDRNLPLRYHSGPKADLFRWEMETTDVDVELDDAVANLDAEALAFADRSLEFVTVRVWLSEHSGGSYRPQQSPIVVELTRLVDPAAMRTPEQVSKFFNDPERIKRVFGELGGR